MARGTVPSDKAVGYWFPGKAIAGENSMRFAGTMAVVALRFASLASSASKTPDTRYFAHLEARAA